MDGIVLGSEGIRRNLEMQLNFVKKLIDKNVVRVLHGDIEHGDLANEIFVFEVLSMSFLY